MALAGLFLAAGRAEAGPLSLGLSAGTSYYQHSAAATSPLEFQGRTLEPRIRFDRETHRSRLRLDARRRFDLYSGAVLGPTLGGRNQVSDHAAVELRQEWSERDRLDADGSFLRSRDVLDVDRRTLALPSEVSEWNGNVSASLGRMNAGYHVRGWSYDDARLDDAVARSWNVRLLPIRGASGAWFVGWHRRELALSGHTAVGSHVEAAGYRRELWPGASVEAEAGASQVTYVDGVRRSGAEGAFEIAGPRWGPNTVSARLQVERAFPATLTARVGRRLGDGRIWLSGASLVDAEGGLYRYPTFTRRVGIGIEDTLARATVLGLEMSQGDVRAFHVDVPRATVVQASAWLERRMRPWLTGRSGVSYLSQAGENSSHALALRRVRVDLALTVLNP